MAKECGRVGAFLSGKWSLREDARPTVREDRK
jgi:hypothetical protein